MQWSYIFLALTRRFFFFFSDVSFFTELTPEWIIWVTVAINKLNIPFCLPSGPKDMFDYEGFFESKIEEKKQDSSYRIFKRVARLGSSFPMAEEHTKERKKISVWCSNDYLGMSWHPAVQSAVV